MLTLLSSRYSFRSTTGVGQSYCIEVAVDSGGRATVVGVRSERGGNTWGACEGVGQYPEELADDVSAAAEAALALWRRDRVGTVEAVFRGEEVLRVLFPWGPLGTDAYLVVVTAADGTTVQSTAVKRTTTTQVTRKRTVTLSRSPYVYNSVYRNYARYHWNGKRWVYR